MINGTNLGSNSNVPTSGGVGTLLLNLLLGEKYKRSTFIKKFVDLKGVSVKYKNFLAGFL